MDDDSMGPAGEDRARFIVDASRRLADAKDYDAALSLAAELAATAVGGACVVDVSEGYAVRRAAAYAGDHLGAWAAEAMQREPDEATLDVLRTQKARLSAGPPPRIIVPLMARGRALGALTIVSTNAARRNDQDDLAFVADLSAIMALAVESARLHHAHHEMLSSVSHDLRNPLNIIGFAVASLRKPGALDVQRAGYVEKVHRASVRMNRIIEDLLDASRLEAGSLGLERDRHRAASLVAEAVDPLRRLAEEKAVRLSVDASDALPELLVDRDRVVKALSIVVGNALEVTKAGGTVGVQATEGQGEVLIRVSDTGPAIRPEDGARVFDGPWQAPSRDRKAGIPLAIARGFVLAHGGRIWVESGAGEGSTFHVVLPSVQESGADVVAGAERAETRAG
jgi:signal transduction histidine kinase